MTILPPSLIFNISPDQPKDSNAISIIPRDGTIDDLEVGFENPDFIRLNSNLEGNKLIVNIEKTSNTYGNFESVMTIREGDIDYRVPILIHSTVADLETSFDGSSLSFNISSPKNWTFATISVFDSKLTKYQTVSVTPNKDRAVFIEKPGQYWIEAKILTDGKALDAFEFTNVESVKENSSIFRIDDSFLPLRQIIIISAILCAGIAIAKKL